MSLKTIVSFNVLLKRSYQSLSSHYIFSYKQFHVLDSDILMSFNTDHVDIFYMK